MSQISQVPIQCPHCKEFFEVKKAEASRRKYCSIACKAEATRLGQRKNCVVCGIEFIRAPTKSIGAKYCSQACYHAAHECRKDCATCGMILKEPRLTYCSWDCFKNGRRQKTEHSCLTCGKIMLLQPYQVGNKKYCSRPCLAESKRIDGPGWKYTRKDGYIHVYYPKHPDSTKAGWMLEHRLVAEEKYGRRILKTEHVHHLNGIKDDNRPENLEIIDPASHGRLSNAEGKRQRRSLKDELEIYRQRFGPLKQGKEE